VALFTIPIVIRGLGIERFGALTLIWAFLGYFALFDLGLGRAVIRLTARHLAPGRESESADSMVGTALVVSAGLGVAGTLVMLAAGHMLLGADILRATGNMERELRVSLAIVAALLPIVTVTSVLNGVLEGRQRFGAVNLIRIPAGILNYLLPVLVLQFSNELPPVVAAIGALRVTVAGVYLVVCRSIVSPHSILAKPSRAWLRPLLSFGGWLTVSNVVGPLMVYLDRFVLGAAASLTATAYYTTPFEVVTKLWIIPGALAATLFPVFAAATGSDAPRTTRLFARGSEMMFYAMVPVAVVIIAFAREGLQLWLGSDFAEKSTLVAQILTLGMLVNAMAFVPMALIQGAGRADIAAKLHLAELPLYVALLWVLVTQSGIVGAAMAWTLRVSADCVALTWLSRRVLEAGHVAVRSLFLTCIGAAATAPAAFLVDMAHRFLFVTAAVAAIAGVAWVRLRNSNAR
jgi:O-antigen/teichoic acid export membrane protein